MKEYLHLLCAVFVSVMAFSATAMAQNSFPLLMESAQKTIVTNLSAAVNEMAQASRPVGGDDETYWAASVVDSLHKVVMEKDRPFLEQMTRIHHMCSYFAYGMNYFSSVIGAYSCPEEAGYARHSVPVCDSLHNNAAASGYKDVMALADLSGHAYFYTQLYVTMLHRINGYEDFQDKDLGYSLQNLALLRYANEKGVFSQDELIKIYFVLDASCFFKSYFGYIMSLTYDDTQREATRSKLIEYAYYIDDVSSPIFEAVYADDKKEIKMTDQEFEAYMLKMTDIKVDMMRRLTEQFILISKEQAQSSTENK